MNTQMVDCAKSWIVEDLLDESFPTNSNEPEVMENITDLFAAVQKANEGTPERELPELIDQKHLIQSVYGFVELEDVKTMQF